MFGAQSGCQTPMETKRLERFSPLNSCAGHRSVGKAVALVVQSVRNNSQLAWWRVLLTEPVPFGDVHF